MKHQCVCLHCSRCACSPSRAARQQQKPLSRLHDVAVILLDAGANVNHRFLGGGTALVWAIQHDDYEMAKLLLARGADHGLFVKEIGGPIYTMNMTNRMRQLILERR